MAHWLVTVPCPHDAAATAAELDAVGGRLRDLEPIPFDDGTEVVYAEGPPDLGRRLRERASPQVLAVHRDSEQQPYG